MCVSHHSCEAGGQDAAAGAYVQGLGSLIQVVVEELQGVGVLQAGHHSPSEQPQPPSSTTSWCHFIRIHLCLDTITTLLEQYLFEYLTFYT